MGKKTSEKADDHLSEFKVGDRVKVNMHRGQDRGRDGQGRHRSHGWQAATGGFWEG